MVRTDLERDLFGVDEHVWRTKGGFNVEGGGYAKCIVLMHEKELEISDAIRFGAILENVTHDECTGKVINEEICS